MAGKINKSCNFCGKPEDMTLSMFSAGDVHICDSCVCYCYEMLYGNGIVSDHPEKKKGRGKKSSEKEINLLKPAEIKKVLDEYVIGQDSDRKSVV